MDVDAIDATRVARACTEATTSTSSAVHEMLALMTMRMRGDDDESSSRRRARAVIARATLTCAREATSGARARVVALERASTRMGKPPSGTTRDGDAATKSVDVACKHAKTTSRLSIADEGEFPALASGARRNLAMALDGSSSETTEPGRPRRVAPTPTPTEETRSSATATATASGFGVSRVQSNGATRRIAPTMVSRPAETMDGTNASFALTSSANGGGGGAFASPASTMKRASASTASTPLALDRLYVTEPRTVEPIRLSPSLARLAELHAAALRGGFPLDQAPEFAMLLQLLSAPADVVVETTDGDALGLCVRTGREARAYACEVLSLVPTLACALGESALETLVESKVVVAHAPTLHAKLVRELGAMRVRSDNCERAYQLEGRLGNTLYGFDLLDALAKASEGGASRSASQSGRVIPISEQQAIEHNRERTRDAFYALLRSSSSRTVGLGQDASVANRARALLANTHPSNVRWLADLFVARLSQSSAVGELDEELGKSITPARLSRLHERIVGAGAAPLHPQGGRGVGGPRADGRGGRGRGRGAGGRGGGHERIINGSGQNAGGFSGDAANAWPSFLCLFPAAQQPFARFIETTDSHKFCVALQRSLVAALHVLDPNASATSSDARVASANASNAGQTERMLAARAMGSFLGLLTFGFASGSTSSTPASEGSAPIHGIDLIGALRRARRRGDLVVSAPWVLAFLRFLPWDSEALDVPHYAEALAYLRAIASSPNLDPSVADAEYNAPRMCLRSILANGLAVRAPATTPQAANWNAHGVIPLPPPPLAAVECLPTTSKETLVAIGDPLDVATWGEDWVPSASANASATANAAEAPDSPSDSDSRIDADVAPDLSRVGVDRRYVETVCPSVDRALKTMRQTAALARALAEETERSTETEPTMKTPSQPANAPRRMQAQAQRIDPTSLARSASIEFGGAFETKNVVSPTFGVTSPTSTENLLKTAPSMDSKSSSTEIKHALQRAFLQTVPGLRRLVDFAVDAATLAAVDDATAAVTATATASAEPAVTAAARHAAMKYAETATANGVSFVPHSGAVIEEAWTPEFERAVERSAMSATRDVIASVARAASDDAGTRAAAAVAALSGASTSRGSSASAGSTAATQTACGVAADAAAFAAADRVRRNLPFELHARVASAARRLLKTALVEAKETLSAPREESSHEAKASKRDAEYASIAASAIASALSAASKWPAGVLLAECASLKTLAERHPDAATLVKGIQSIVECVRKVLDQDAKFSRAQTSRKKPSVHVEKTIPASRPGEALQAKLGQLSRSFVKLLLAAPQNALSKTTKAKTAEEGWGISRDEVCDGLTSTLVAVFTAAAPALELLSALAPPDARDPWRGVYDDMFASELWLASLREFPESPFAQRRVELVFAEALAKLPRRSIAAESFLHLIDDADKRVGRLGYALAMRGAIRFSAIVADTTTHDADQDADSIELAAFASALRDRCAAAGEIRLARRAETAARALRAGTVFANIKSIAR